jgi:hypothetical protein
LEGNEHSNGIAPALGAAAMVGRSSEADHRPGCGAGSAMPGLSLGISHWFSHQAAGGAWAHSEALRNKTGEPP